MIVAAGEVHLQRCVDDLTERFAKIKVRSFIIIIMNKVLIETKTQPSRPHPHDVVSTLKQLQCNVGRTFKRRYVSTGKEVAVQGKYINLEYLKQERYNFLIYCKSIFFSSRSVCPTRSSHSVRVWSHLPKLTW